MRCRLLVLACLMIPGLSAGCSGPARPQTDAASSGAVTPATGGAIRFTGLLEAVRSRTIAAPRLSGTPTPMIITFLARPGTRVKEDERVLAFDQQEQTRLANDKRAELVDLESQIDRKKAAFGEEGNPPPVRGEHRRLFHFGSLDLVADQLGVLHLREEVLVPTSTRGGAPSTDPRPLDNLNVETLALRLEPMLGSNPMVSDVHIILYSPFSTLCRLSEGTPLSPPLPS